MVTQNNQSSSLQVYVERLDFFSWLFNIFPYLILQRKIYESIRLYYLDASSLALAALNLTSQIFKIKTEQIQYRIVDIKDEKGLLVRLRLSYFDMNQVFEEIQENPVFQQALTDPAAVNRIPTFLSKQISSYESQSHLTLWRALMLIQVARWHSQKISLENAKVVLFMQQRVWKKEIGNYSQKCGVETNFTQNIFPGLKPLLRNLMGANVRVFQNFYFYLRKKGLVETVKKAIQSIFQRFSGPGMNLSQNIRMAVEYYGHLNLEQKGLNSDVFFWQPSVCPGEDFLVIYHLPQDPLDDQKLQQMSRHNIQPAVLKPKASKVKSIPVFYHLNQRIRPQKMKLQKANRIGRWINRQINQYYADLNYWVDFFTSYNVKVYITWYCLDSSHCVIADALEYAGGVTAVYQRSWMEFPTSETRVSSDIVFAVSPMNIEIERKSGSRIPYHIITGYYGDYRFPLLKPYSQTIRNQLLSKGARHILAFFDESSLDDARWHTGHEFMRENYQFLLEKLLALPQMGIIFKPKIPATLEKRLGPVADLLREAKKTGRCHVFEGGTLHGSFPPAVAALAADVTVHGHLCGATAGMEAALAGCRTLLLDREGWSVSPLYQLKEGKVVFRDWNHLWNVLDEYWNKGVDGFGDWSGMIDKIDPFRDGRAAERIGTYLKWIMEGFKANLPREKILADAAQRYSDIWGKDKVNQIL